MKSLLYFSILFVPGAVFGQIHAPKKAFASPQLDYLEFRNDTSLVTTLLGDWDTTSYLIRGDSLLIKKEYWESDSSGHHHWIEWRGFKLLSRKADTICMLNPFRGYSKPSGWQDTTMFVCLDNLKEPIRSFGYLRITEQSPWTGTSTLLIDNTGRLTYYREKREVLNPEKNTTGQVTTRMLSKLEIGELKDVLSYSLLSKLRRFRGGCDAMDAGRTTIEIVYNDRKIVSKGCTTKWPHALLLAHLYGLAERKK
jgi:hypothetical protein